MPLNLLLFLLLPIILSLLPNLQPFLLPLLPSHDHFISSDFSKFNLISTENPIFKRKNLAKLLEFKFFLKNYLFQLETEKSSFLLGLSLDFGGIWLKDKNCSDCSIFNGEPICDKSCGKRNKFTSSVMCMKECRVIKKNKTALKMAKYLEKVKIVETEVKFGGQIEYKRVKKIFLALMGINMKFFNGDGQLGLLMKKENEKYDGFFFVDDLLQEKMIFSNSFSVYLGWNTSNSHLNFGEYNKNYMVDESLNYLNIMDEEFSIFVSQIMIMEKKLNVSKKAYFSLEDDFIGLPNDTFRSIMKNFTKELNLKCYVISDNVFCSLPNDDDLKLPHLTLYLGVEEKEFIIPNNTIFDQCQIIRDQNDMEKYCLLKIQKNKDFVIGLPFFETFYTYFDLENKKVGVGKAKKEIPLVFHEKEGMNDGREYNLVFNENMLFLVLCLLIVIFITVLFVLRKKRKYEIINDNNVSNSNLQRIETVTDIHNESFIGDSFNFDYDVKENEDSEQKITITEELGIDDSAREIKEGEEVFEVYAKQEKEDEEIEEIIPDSIVI